MKLDKQDIALTNCCALEQERPILTCLSLRNGQLTAADGFLLVTRKADTDDDEDTKDILLPKDTLKVLGSQITERGNIELTFEEENKVRAIIRPNSFGIPKNFILRFQTEQSGPFPHYEELLNNSPTQKKAQVAIQISKLKQILSTMPNDGIVKIGINEPSQPIELQCNDEHSDRPITAMIMPMFIHWSDFKWYRPTPQPK
jgi:DNA polymerase III sliding clamp (beta) subunit (PCNA family)